MVDVSVPVVSDWLESLKTLTTSIRLLSGGCAPMPSSAVSRSPGSLTPLRSDRSAVPGPPSMDSGPSSLVSRCVAAGNVTTFSRPGGSEYAVSAPYSMRCCLNHAFAAFGSPLKVATAASRVTTTLAPAANGKPPSPVNSSFSSWVALSPRITPILKSAQVAPSVVHTRTRWPSRKPSASQLEPSARTRRRLAVSKVALPVHRPWRTSLLTSASLKVPLAPVASVSVIVDSVTDRIDAVPVGRAHAGEADRLPGREALVEEGADVGAP